jgi:putative membrane protein
MHGLYYGFGNMGRLGIGRYGWYGVDWWSRGMMIGLLLIGVTVVVLIAVHLSHRNRSNSGSLEAIELLKNRYANGEIDSELFEKMKKDLR